MEEEVFCLKKKLSETMSNPKSGKDSPEERLRNLEPEDLKQALRLFREKIHHEYAAYLHTCVRCGLCSDSCHYYLTDSEVKSLPAYKLNLIAKVFKKYFTLAGESIPKWVDSKSFLGSWINFSHMQFLDSVV